MKARELESRELSEYVLIDVRTPVEYEVERIEGTTLIPLDQFTEEKFKAACLEGEGKPVVMICKAGKRAEAAVAKLSAEVAENVCVLEGGMTAWRAAGCAIVEGERNVIPLERQVFIGAGAMIVLGTVLGFLVHTGFFLVAGGVGAGLTFAGLTGKCGLAMVLAKMPWNQCASAEIADKEPQVADCGTGG